MYDDFALAGEDMLMLMQRELEAVQIALPETKKEHNGKRVDCPEAIKPNEEDKSKRTDCHEAANKSIGNDESKRTDRGEAAIKQNDEYDKKGTDCRDSVLKPNRQEEITTTEEKNQFSTDTLKRLSFCSMLIGEAKQRAVFPAKAAVLCLMEREMEAFCLTESTKRSHFLSITGIKCQLQDELIGILCNCGDAPQNTLYKLLVLCGLL